MLLGCGSGRFVAAFFIVGASCVVLCADDRPRAALSDRASRAAHRSPAEAVLLPVPRPVSPRRRARLQRLPDRGFGARGGAGVGKRSHLESAVPPHRRRQASAADPAGAGAVRRWVTAALAAGCDLKDPGPRHHRRLNRAEYTQHDSRPSRRRLPSRDDFPSDDVGYGFDNIGDVLSVSPILIEKHPGGGGEDRPARDRDPGAAGRAVRGGADRETGGAGVVSGAYASSTRSARSGGLYLPRDGDYLLRARAYGEPGRGAPAVWLQLDSTWSRRPLDVSAPGSAEGLRSGSLRAGKASTGWRLRYGEAARRTPSSHPYPLAIDYLEIVGPLNHGRHRAACQPPAGSSHLPGSQRPGGRSRAQDLPRTSQLAYRRPRNPEGGGAAGRDRYEGDRPGRGSFERGIQLAVARAARLPALHIASSWTRRRTIRKRPGCLSDWELASRLSHQTPLEQHAGRDPLPRWPQRGVLHRPEVLTAQARRMLKDPKAHALVETSATSGSPCATWPS